MNWTSAVAAPSSLLGLATTLHIGLTLVRKHRSAPKSWLRPVLLPSLLFVVVPWVFQTPRQLVMGLGGHLIWFLVAQLLVPAPRPVAKPAVAVARPAATASAPTPAPAPATARPTGFVTTPVLAIFDETSDIRTFRMARPEGFDFVAGQFLTVGVQINGQRVARCYSISSAPEATGYLEISVKRQGLVSGLLHSTAGVGTQLSIRPPAGRFVYPVGDDRPLVLLAGGVGCTPLISMLRHAVSCDPTRPVRYLFSGRTEQDIAFRQELGLLARRHPQLRIAVALTKGAGGPGFHVGRIDETLLRRAVADPLSSLFYVCGPTPMIDGMKTLLRGLGVPEAQIRSEAFGAAVAASSDAAAPVAAAPRPVPKVPGAASAKGSFQLRLTTSGRTTKIGAGQTLLEAAEAVQVEIPNSCRAGTCGTCRTRLVEGEVDCDGDALDPGDREKGYILPCVAWARGDCALEA